MKTAKRLHFSWLLLVVLLGNGLRSSVNAAPNLTEAQQQQLDKLIEQLHSKDLRALYHTMQALLKMGPQAAGAKDQLIEMLDDTRILDNRSRSIRGGPPVNRMAVSILRNIGPEGVGGLIIALGNKHERIRLQAAESLVNDDHTIDPQHWIRVLKDKNPWMQIFSVRALGEAKNPAAFRALCQAVQESPVEVRIETAGILGKLANPDAIDPLLASLSDKRATANAYFNLQIAVGGALAKMGPPAIETLLKRFEAFDKEYRFMANYAIGQCDPQPAKQLLLKLLESEHWQLREGALYSLAKLKNDEVLRLVIQHAQDADWNVRWRVAHLLGELANNKNADEIRPLLIRLAGEDKKDSVRNRALWTLYFFPGLPTESYLDLLQASLADPSPRVRASAADSANKFWDLRFAAPLIKLLADKNAHVRSEAAAALGTGKVISAIPELIRQLSDEDPYAQRYSAFALTRIGTDRAVNALISQVHNDRLPNKRRNLALEALCYTKNPKAKAILTAALKDDQFRSNHFLIRRELKKFDGK